MIKIGGRHDTWPVVHRNHSIYFREWRSMDAAPINSVTAAPIVPVAISGTDPPGSPPVAAIAAAFSEVSNRMAPQAAAKKRKHVIFSFSNSRDTNQIRQVSTPSRNGRLLEPV